MTDSAASPATSKPSTGSAGERPEKSLFGVAVLVLVVVVGVAATLWATGVLGSPGKVVVDETPSQYQQSAWSMQRQQWAQRRAQATLDAPDAVRSTRAGANGRPVGVEVKAGKSRLVANRAGQNWRLVAESLDPAFVSPEVRLLLTLRTRGAQEDAVARQLNLTDDQRKRLAALPRGIAYPLDDAVRTRLETLVTAYGDAADDAARNKVAAELIAAVHEVERSQEEPTRQALVQRAEKVKQIVSPEQVRQFQEMGRPPR